jgi:glycosyltransferase involved in cell wall biosynthesis
MRGAGKQTMLLASRGAMSPDLIHQERRIVHVTPCAGTVGFGVATVVRELSTAQTDLGMNVRVWSTDADSRRPDGLGSGVTWTRFSTRGPSLLAWAPKMMAAARAVDKPTIIHQHGIWTAVSTVTRYLHEQRGVPSVVAPHGSLQKWALQKSRTRKAVALLLYEKGNLFNCSCLHALSTAELTDCRAFGLRNPVAIIPNGVSEQWLVSKGNGSSFRSKHRIDTETRILLYVGRITPIKGLPMLCHSMAAVRNKMHGWILVIVGSDEFGHMAELAETIHQLELNKSILFAGPLFGSDKRDAFAAADAFVLPSYGEALPMAVLEAMGVSLPVVVTRATPIPEIEQSSCGWRVPADTDSLADVLTDLAQRTPESLRSMGSNGRNVVLEHYTWQHVACMTVELYSWLDGKAERPRFVVEE